MIATLPNPSSRTALQRRLATRYGPWALVTGASDGIGRAFAEALAAAGLNVVLVARRGEVLEHIGKSLRSVHGVEVRVVAADLATADGVEQVVRASVGLDVGLVVAAAGFGTSGAFLTTDVAEELSMVDVNCRAVVGLSHAFAKRLVARGRGGLVLLSSVVAFQGVAQAANYAATKAFVQSLAEGLALELGPKGVDVLASAPGPVESGFARRASMTMGRAASPAEVANGSLAALGRRGTTRPGFLSKLLGWSLATLPRWGRVRVMSLVMGGMARPAV